MIPLNEIQVVEFSVSQQAYHVETLDRMLITNLTAVALNKPVDYLPIGFFHSYEAANNFISKHKMIHSLRTKGTPSIYKPVK